ncbi:sigma-70 family RNA polymerase sigma factor [uncultured Rubinisphaera sp.]|uniref:RNA polymerase sigma factor n=1 Tax=uncultured Rubinisphaera sp. TaxID=1678686 RepID=UPI000ECE0257|nr:hypothetical protein [Planctomycetaceae bacterium]|tara:strand:- start:103 stop:630 length:528 start_codon:yes stop_codon:yes gene_type:complete
MPADDSTTTEFQKQRFDRWYDNYAPRIMAFIASRVRHKESARDISQTVWKNVWRASDSYQEQNFSGWVHQIARNEIANYGRKRTQLSQEQPNTAFIEQAIHQPHNAPEERLLYLQDCIEQAGEPYRTTILLFFQEELSYEQIAEQTSLPQGTIASRVSRGKLAIGDCIKRKMNSC